MFGYVLDDKLWEETNRNGRNHWDVYIQEMADWLGLRGAALSLSDLDRGGKLIRLRTLIVGQQAGARLSDQARANLDAWVREGGTLIGFAVPGLDHVFGVANPTTIKQVPDEYAISGYLDLRPHRFAEGVHSPLRPDQQLIIVSDIRAVEAAGADEVAQLCDTTGDATDQAAVTWHSYGKGHAGYFAFDMAKTVWLLHQGRPVSEAPQGFRAPSAADQRIISANSIKVAYADELLYLLQNMIASTGQPFIYQMPPDGDTVPDALFYWGGDCGGGGPEMIAASDWMKRRGLPYHVNVHVNLLPEGWESTLQHLQANGHEVSLHYYAYETKDLNEANLRAQSDTFFERYGFRPGSSVVGSCHWIGWADTARWLVNCGNSADNSFGAINPLPAYPTRNDAWFGSGYGTFSPFFFYDDWAHGNRRIELIEQPIVWYELGHHGSARDRDKGKEIVAVEEVDAPLDMALHYHLVMNIFYHPGYIAGFPICRAAITRILKRIAQRGAHVLHMGNNELAEWWHVRSRATLDEVVLARDSLRFRYSCDHHAGMIVKVPLLERAVSAATCAGRAVHHRTRVDFGSKWLYVVLPAGSHHVEVKFKE